jgi:hypothetical protein
MQQLKYRAFPFVMFGISIMAATGGAFRTR